MMLRWQWLRSALERALKSTAQALILVFGSTVTGWMALNWAYVGYAAGGAFVLSILTSIVSTPFGPDKDDPSLV